ncbi:hypothetical protein BGX26_009239, partial [Mortierella sp. AD094]
PIVPTCFSLNTWIPQSVLMSCGQFLLMTYDSTAVRIRDTWYGPGFIAMIDETLDSQLYIRILEEELQMSIEERGMAKEELVFQHDNDP